MNRTSLTVALFALVAAAGCEKSSDVGRMHDEAIALANHYAPKIDALDLRAKQLSQRGRVIGQDAPGIREASQTLGAAGNLIANARGTIDSVLHVKAGTSALDTATKANNPEDIQKIIIEMREHVDKDMLEANDSLDAVDSWIAIAETRPSAPPPPRDLSGPQQ